jgi:hypothetical protein
VAGLGVCKRQCFLLPLGARSTGTLQVSATSGYARNVSRHIMTKQIVNYQDILTRQIDLYVNWIIDRMTKYFEKDYDRKQLRSMLEKQFENNTHTSKLASELGHFFKFWGTDWHWVAFHITQDYYSQRKLFETLSFLKRDPNQVLVYKSLGKNSCEKSRQLYLTNFTDLKSEPKVFSLNELIQNGTNLGVEPNQLKPTLGITDFGTFKDKFEEVHLIYDEYYLNTKDFPDDVWDYSQQTFVPNKQRKEHLKEFSKFVKTEIRKENVISADNEKSTAIYVKINAKGLKKYYDNKKKRENSNFITRILNLFKNK